MMKYLLTWLTLCLFFTTSLTGQLQLVEAPGNIYHLLIHDTPDGGALLVGKEDCYTPGSQTIHGCSYAQHLTRLDANGDTLWTNTFASSTQEQVKRIFTNADGSFTFIGSSASSYSCGDISIGGSFGMGRIEMVRVDTDGVVIRRFVTDNECDLALLDVVRIAEDRYAVLANYGFFGSDNVLRTMIMNGDGDVLRESANPRSELRAVDLHLNANQELELLYYKDSTYVREIMDTLFQPVRVATSPNIWTNGIRLENGNFFTENVWADDGSVHQIYTRHRSNPRRQETGYVRYDRDMNLRVRADLPETQRIRTLQMDGNGDLLYIAMDTAEDGGDIVYRRIDTLGNIVGGEVIRLPGKQEPVSFSLGLDSLSILIAGNQNCCNQEVATGPGQTFYYTFGTTGNENPRLPAGPAFLVYPNPADEELNVRTLAGPVAPEVRLRLFDPRGRFILSAPADQVIRVTDLDPAIYFYQLTDDTGILQTGKIIKK